MPARATKTWDALAASLRGNEKEPDEEREGGNEDQMRRIGAYRRRAGRERGVPRPWSRSPPSTPSRAGRGRHEERSGGAQDCWPEKGCARGVKEEGKTGHEVVKKEARDESKAGPTGRQRAERREGRGTDRGMQAKRRTASW